MNISKYQVGTYVRVNCLYFNHNMVNKVGIIIDVVHMIENFVQTDYYKVDIFGLDKPILIEEEFLTPKPKLDFEAKIILLGLYKSGYKYIAKDKNDFIYAYVRYPVKAKFSDYSWSDRFGDFKYSTHTSHMLNTYLDKLCSWEDLEPTSISWLLGINEDNISEHNLN